MAIKQTTNNRVPFNESKFKELILYIAEQCQEDKYYGATWLNKVLFYSDFIAYQELGKPITGADYMAIEHGPVPRRLVPIRTQMVDDKIAVMQRLHQQDRLIPLRTANLGSFTADEIALVDKVINLARHANAERISNGSHAFLGWKAAWAEGQATGKNVSIPYETACIANPPLDEFEEARYLELARRHGWRI